MMKNKKIQNILVEIVIGLLTGFAFASLLIFMNLLGIYYS